MKFRNIIIVIFILISSLSTFAAMLNAMEDSKGLPDGAISEIKILYPRYRNCIYVSHWPDKIRAYFKSSIDQSEKQNILYATTFDDEKPVEWHKLKIDNTVEAVIDSKYSTKKEITLNVYFKGIPGIDKRSTTLKIIPLPSKGNEIIIGGNNETIINGKPIFPAGFYSMAQGDENKPIAKAGYNIVVGGKIHSLNGWLDNCKAAGLYGIVKLPRKFAVDKDENAIREFIRNIKDHPALFGYYLFDEPNPGKVNQTPDKIKQVYDVIVNEDPYHPVIICINKEEFTIQYFDCLDVLLVDFYPVLKKKNLFKEFSQNIDKNLSDINSAKPVWPVIQSFGQEITKGLGDKAQIKTPTQDQERCMTYLVLTKNIKGLMYYSYHVFTEYNPVEKDPGNFMYKLGGYLPDEEPELWSALVNLGTEIARIGYVMITNEKEFGVEGSVHWMSAKTGKSHEALFVCVNLDDVNAAEFELAGQFSGLSQEDMVYGAGTISKADGKKMLVLEPMGTFAAKFKSSNLNNDEK